MAMDSLSQALAQRRGKSLDPSILTVNSPHSAIDHEAGMDGAASAMGEAHGTNTGAELGNLPHPGMQHTAVKGEGEGMNAPADRKSMTHLDEHTPVAGEHSGAPQPLSQSPGMGEGELKAEIAEHVGGHGSQGEYEQLKDQRPRSLGERAKMAALKDKYEKK